jgi:hypothetical protein
MTSITTPAPTGDDLAGFSWFNGLTDGERTFWLAQAGSAAPIDAWKAFKRVQAGQPPTERPGRPGRPPKPTDERLVSMSIRLTERQKARLQAAGGIEALRAWIDTLEQR